MLAPGGLLARSHDPGSLPSPLPVHHPTDSHTAPTSSANIGQVCTGIFSFTTNENYRHFILIHKKSFALWTTSSLQQGTGRNIYLQM